MQDIDFLPSDFKRRRSNRHGRPWQIVVACAAIGLLLVVAVGQSRALTQIKGRLTEIEPERRVLDARLAQLADLRERLAGTEARAQLLSYRNHPWPKTQLLAATLRSLPDAVVFRRIQITPENLSSLPSQRASTEAEEEDATTLAPAVRDMRLLQQECDSSVVAITLEGTTTDGIELHRYLDRLNRVPLLDKVTLHSLDSTEDDSEAKFRFEARLTVRPGFGQPGGPDGRSSQVAQANSGLLPTLPNTSRP
ncbi:MAG: hypothetical protein GXX96_19670 [Planctomycetaceae bacterium]|nr:hypothetical protein [Planctomycetaceae bacterium]